MLDKGDDLPLLGSSALAAVVNSVEAGWPRLAIACSRPGSFLQSHLFPLMRVIVDLCDGGNITLVHRSTAELGMNSADVKENLKTPVCESVHPADSFQIQVP